MWTVMYIFEVLSRGVSGEDDCAGVGGVREEGVLMGGIGRGSGKF